jgi:thioredoxin-like negative regulator of GroEL
MTTQAETKKFIDEKDLLNKTGPKAYVFTSDTCMPCKRLKEYLSLHYEEYDTDFIYINVSKYSSLVDNMNITSVPQTHVYNDGKKLGVIMGGNIEKFSKELSALLS